ncbi:MAG: 3-oxoacyl-[acyl-carrier-protein] reductase [Pseudomonadota bacterium]
MGEEKTPVAVVTGGSRGIGRAMVLRLAAAGARVMFTYAANEAAAAQVEEAAGGRAKGFRFDVADAAAVAAFFDGPLKEAGRLDWLVNNAGITRDRLLVRMTDDDWDRVLEVNLKGAFLCTRAAAKIMMKQRSGAVVNISSVVAEMGNVGQVNYVASKAGLIGLTKACARELAGRGIRVNAVAPGFIETEMTAGLAEDIRQRLLAGIPLARFGVAEEVAAAAEFLLGEGAAYITGQVLHVGGGLYI